MNQKQKPAKVHDARADRPGEFAPPPHWHARRRDGGYAGIDPKAARRAVRRGGVTGGV